MSKNKKTFAGTKVGYFPPRFYHNRWKLSNTQEYWLLFGAIVLEAVFIIFALLFITNLI